MDPVLEEMEFLARSTNRVDVLRLLAADSHTRRELLVETDASQPTLGRILGDFEDRNWITHRDDQYVATATGRLVAEGLGGLYDSLEVSGRLCDLVAWLPAEALEFDLRRLRSARITVPTQTRPSAPVGRVVDLVRDAEHVRVLSHAFNERTLSAVSAWVEAGGRFEGVFSAAAIDAVADDPALARRLRTLAAADAASIRVFEGRVPVAVTVADRVVSLLLRDDAGRLQAALDTDDEAVHAWATELHTRYWDDADPLAASEISAPNTDE